MHSMKTSELQCTTHRGKYKWSSTLGTAGKKVFLLSTIWRLSFHIPVIAQLFHSELQNYNLNPSDLDTPLKIKEQRQKVIQDLHPSQSQATNLREVHLQERAHYYSQLKHVDPQWILQQIKHTESTQLLYRKLRYIKEKHTSQGVSSIITTEPQGGNTHIYDPDEVHDHILNRNKSVFEKVNGSLPTSQSFQNLCGRYGEKYKSSNISNLPTCTTDIQNHTLTQLLMPHPITINTMSPYRSPEELHKLLQNTRENTSSSPSNLHMGHYITISYSKLLLDIMSIVISPPFVYGFTHKRWNKSTHHILEKSQDIP